MAYSYEITQRQFTRVENLITTVTATPEDRYLALKAICPEMLGHCLGFKVADAGVKAQERVGSRELAEAKEASKPLRAFYDEVRLAVMAKIPGQVHPAPSAFATNDDLFNACEDLEDVLEERQGETWAKPLFDRMVATLDAAVKEASEASVAMQTLQKLQAQRKVAALAARPTFVAFRRVVRTTFGRPSKEYRSILDRRGVPAEEDIETPAAPGAPAAP